MAKKPDTVHGKIFENNITAAMKGVENQLPIRFSKITDSFAAGNIIQAVDSDFKLQIKSPHNDSPYLIYIEAKATVLENDFAHVFRSFVKGTQNASMVMNMRAGAAGCYFFHKVNEGIFEVWDAGLVGKYYFPARKPIDGHAAYTVAHANLAQFMLRICSDPSSFLQALRSTRQ